MTHPEPRSPADVANPPAARGRRLRQAVVTVAIGGGLALGVAGLAYAAEPGSPSAAPSPTAPAAPPAPRPHTPHLDGTVKTVGSGRLTIVDRDGFTRQIAIATIPADVKAGTHIHAEGSVNADGVTLDATSVRIAPEPAGPGPGGPGKHGKDPGGPGPDGKAPDGSRPAPGGSSPGGAQPAPGGERSGTPTPSASS